MWQSSSEQYTLTGHVERLILESLHVEYHEIDDVYIM